MSYKVLKHLCGEGMDAKKDETIEEVLLGLIADSDLEEVVCCLDFIAKKEGKRIVMFTKDGRIYPAQPQEPEINGPSCNLAKPWEAP